jgi:hypothetical protein
MAVELMLERSRRAIGNDGHCALRGMAMISSSGNIEAARKDEADISISDSGRVSRPARSTSHVAGSGRVNQLPVESTDRK